jgi:hypothetical protein
MKHLILSLSLSLASFALAACAADSSPDPQASQPTAEESQSVTQICSKDIPNTTCSGKQFHWPCRTPNYQCLPVDQEADGSWDCICSQQSVE